MRRLGCSVDLLPVVGASLNLDMILKIQTWRRNFITWIGILIAEVPIFILLVEEPRLSLLGVLAIEGVVLTLFLLILWIGIVLADDGPGFCCSFVIGGSASQEIISIGIFLILTPFTWSVSFRSSPFSRVSRVWMLIGMVRESCLDCWLSWAPVCMGQVWPPLKGGLSSVCSPRLSPLVCPCST